MRNITPDKIRTYITKLHESGEADVTIRRKIISLGRFADWAHQKGIISNVIFKQVKEVIDKELKTLNVRPSTLEEEKNERHSGEPHSSQVILNEVKDPGQRPAQQAASLDPSQARDDTNVPSVDQFEKIAYRGLKETDGVFGEARFRFHLQTYKIRSAISGLLKRAPLIGSRHPDESQDLVKTGSPITVGDDNTRNYVVMGFLLILMSFLGSGIYNNFFKKAPTPFAYPSQLVRATRTLSFQGRLTDSLGNPITTATNVKFKLYSTASTGSSLYDSGVCAITPDQDGIFNTHIGRDCGAELGNSVFSENANVYMGVTVGSDAEMSPRQPIATVGYAQNAETLQGLPAGTTTSTIPFINQDGNIMLAASTTGVRSTFESATFTISSANAVTIQSAGTGDVVLAATGSGTLQLRTGGNDASYTRLHVDDDGNVGIGTTSPVALLDVAGTLRVGSTAAATGTAVCINGSNILSSCSDAFVTGSGTTNFLPKWTASTVLANSVIYDNGTNVGIGTTSPSVALDVVGAGKFSSTIQVQANSKLFSGSGVPSSGIGSDGDYYFRTDGTTGNTSIYYKTGGVWISAGGGSLQNAYAVGNSITTTTGSNIDFILADVASATSFTLTNQDTGVSAFILNDTNGATNTLIDVQSAGVTKLLVKEDGTIGTVGNVGIGSTAATGATLDVTGTGRFSSTLTASSGLTLTTGALNLTSTSGAANLTLSSSTTAFNVNSGVFDIDTTNSRVGIGTTAPSQKLDVQGAVRLGAAGGTDDIVNTTAAGGAPSGDLFWGNRELCDSSGNCSGAGNGPWDEAAGVVYTDATTNNVTIGATGNVAKLGVIGDVDEFQLLVRGNATQTNNIAVFEHSSGTDLLTLDNNGQLAIGMTGSAGGMVISGWGQRTRFRKFRLPETSILNPVQDLE
jgi:hypothetical protein